MFEAHVLHLLKRYLGEYVHGLSLEALRVSVWKGDVVLKDLKLKAEALNSLKLPVTVKAGFIGTITLKVPWKSLGKEPVIVLIDRVFVLANPAPDGRTLKEEDRERLFEDKLHQIEEAEAATVEAMSRSKLGSHTSGNSWLGSLIGTIIGNLKITISNVHIRYEDSKSNPGRPFSCGVTLAKLAAVTMDEQGNETFDTSGALDKLRKSLQLERLAIYHDSNKPPWTIDKGWQDLIPSEWIEIFEEGVNEPVAGHEGGKSWALNRTYLVSPINGVLRYHRLGSQERNDADIPFEKASLFLNDVSLTVTEAQYYDWIKLLEVVSRYRMHIEVSHLRPVVPVPDNPRLWWRYAVQASLQQRKMCYRFSWERMQHLCQLRRRYIQVYANLLQQLPDVDNLELRQIEKDLDSKVILLWRLLAHAKVESVKTKEAAEQKRLGKKGWFSFNWRSAPEDADGVDGSDMSELTQEKLTKEEWQVINNLLSYQPDGELGLYSGKDAQSMIQFMVDVSIGQAAAKIINIHETEVLCGRFEQLNVSTKLKHRSIYCDVSLKLYGLYAPEGCLAQSVCSEEKQNALAANFVRSPIGENVDWRLSSTMCPCHVTVLMESYDRFMEFIKRSNAVSPTVAMETATALQMKFEKVTRKAQEQFQLVLEEQSRFALDVDFDAPKVRVPIHRGGSSKCESHFLLDFGHFTLKTKDGQNEEKDQSLYSRFYISGRDIAAFFTDYGSEIQDCSLFSPPRNCDPSGPPSESTDNVCSLVDRCGMAVIIDQIKVPHPKFPSTHVSVQVPNLGVHISPSRYCRVVKLLSIFYGTFQSSGQSVNEVSEPEHAPWLPADMAVEARILVWKGIGNSVAAWQPSFVALSGFYLYVLESERAYSYQRCTSMAGKQVFEVPPANVGGSLFSVAVCLRGMDIQKALESSSTLIVEFQNEDDKHIWLKGLVKATYQASASLSIGLLEDSSYSIADQVSDRAASSQAADLVINGTLAETNLYIYGKCGEESQGNRDEQLIVELIGIGGKVHVIRSDGNLTVKMKLHSLRIKDELQSQSTRISQYLAYSVVKTDQTVTSPSLTDSQADKNSPMLTEEDDMFRDALQEFMPNADMTTVSHNSQILECDALEISNSSQDFGKGKGSSSEIFYEALGSDNSDFVSVVFTTKDPSSPDYEGIDTQMSVCMSKLEFFCNRPTLVALIQFGLEISSANCGVDDEGVTMACEDTETTRKTNKSDDGDAFVKGLLGYGKGRVVFKLSMDVDSVTVFLNHEDGSQFAMLIQESFILHLQVHPCSISIGGTLGNFRLRDMSLGEDDCWNWLCDIRNPGAESLIKFEFKSYSPEDDDYEGYDYSLSGRLSAVRLVFLYRFIREVSVYFMELATPHKEEVIKMVDKVGGLEWMIQKYEMDGATAIKLDLSLETPIIIIPKHSTSKDFMQLDLGQLQIRNSFSWHGNPENDHSAVHLDVLRAEILGFNLAVGIDGCLGRPMIREGQGLVVCVRRSLRDVFRKVPTLGIEVQVDSLHVVMSDKEYNVILNCAYTNLYEEPRLPPSFRASKSDPHDTMKLLVDRVNANSQSFLSRTVSIVAVEINYALLELRNGMQDESTLAHISLEGLWVSYRMTSLAEADLYVTIPKFSIVDVRHDTKPEMRLMLGTSCDVGKQTTASFNNSSSVTGNLTRAGSGVSSSDMPISTMVLLDYRWRATSQSSVVRVQQPRVLVVPDFLIAVAEFFVPSLGAITGRDELMDPNNDPICKSSSIKLISAVYRQVEEVIQLSPSQQLIVDAAGVDDYLYDGCGKTICLKEDTDYKDFQPSKTQPIIVIGRGKRLRFVNVKIENGNLLRKYTYLSNQSSYSAAPEDGVEIKFMENHSSDEDKDLGGKNESSHKPNSCVYPVDETKKTQSFTFEAQVVSPELTFYDGTKSSHDDSPYSEKLVRAKFDLSFMFASNEEDTWVRAVLKDLTIEAGSGLTILNPMDVSGAYTSVKDKTNMSLMCTDMHFHLSLSVISLLLNLQNQVAGALQFGNANPVASCTNFEQIWVSPKENGSKCNLTFWRPRAPSNYVILGDCVTSRSIPPSEAMTAVSNTYGRVRKPLGFKLVGLLSEIIEFNKSEGNLDGDRECSLWLPVAPPGYVALGCVANTGVQPPPLHIVFCLRADLVTSTTFSECLFNVPSNPHFPSGFSIWRLDSMLGSFYANPSVGSPPKEVCYDLVHSLKWGSHWHHSSSRRPASKSNLNYEPTVSQGSEQFSSTSGWEVLRSYSRSHNCFMSVPNFERIWLDKGGEFRRPVSIWRPITRPGYAILGDCITEGLEPPTLGIIFLADNPEISARPVQFTRVANVIGKGMDDAFFWYPLAPPGYVAIGCIVTRTDEPPRAESFCCPRLDLVGPASIVEVPVSRSSSSKGSHCWSLWKVQNQACTFLARADLKKPSSRLAFTIGDSAKPKARENVTSEMKLRCLSVTVLDSLGGMMTPFFDLTFTNIKLVTHGRIEAMNSVLISSMAASTFNRTLEAWEPLVEPFDGIFKFETYDTNVHQNPGSGKRIRIAATSVLNLNVSAANLDTFAEGLASWKRQRELDQKAAKINEDAGGHHRVGDDSRFSALDEDDFQTIVIENKLGRDFYVKKLEQNSDTVEILHDNRATSIWLPPPRFPDRLNVADNNREARYYFAVNILEVKDIPMVDDGNSHNFFCALRLVVDNQPVDQQKLFPQSARTKCCSPVIVKSLEADLGTAKWNELFIFEVPRKGAAKLEVEVTNLAAKAGKGEVVGSSSFAVGHGTNMLRKISSSRMLHQQHTFKNIASHPLHRKDKNDEGTNNVGSLLVSTSYFERKIASDLQNETFDENVVDSDVGFLVALRPDGPWESLRSLLPLSVIPKFLEDNLVAMEVVMRNGKKHAIFRSLATVINDTNLKLDLTVQPSSMIDTRTGDARKGMEGIVTLDPGSSFILPWRSMSREFEKCLFVRPFVNLSAPSYSWGLTAAISSAYNGGKDQQPSEQGSLYRQSTMKHGSTANSAVFKLNELEKKDTLLCCLPSVHNKQFWLSICTDASVLHTELNAPVYDWKISLSPPLKLENRLPCPVEFTIWERTKEGKGIERQQGSILSRKTAHIHNADPRKPVYLSLFIQGGWTLEKDPVAILDLSSIDHVSSFWMVNQQSKRRLRVSIERDLGGSITAPKIIRFFVPYWIINDFSLPLAYRIVEIEPLDTGDSSLLKSGNQSVPRKNVQILDVIQDTSPTPSMLSPQDYVGRGGVLLFTSRNDTYLSPKVGIAVAVRDSENYSPGISLLELEKKGRVDVKAISSDGSYYKLSAQLNMTSDRTKVVHFQPHTLFMNRAGFSVFIQQCGTMSVEHIRPTDPPKPIRWQSSSKAEMLKVRVDGYKWSRAFSVGSEGLMSVVLESDADGSEMNIRVAVRSGTRNSRYEVIFRPNSLSSPYRIENRSMFLPIHFRQVDGPSDSWRCLAPNAASSYIWEDVGRRRLLELFVDGSDPQRAVKYNIDEVFDHQPMNVGGGPTRAIYVAIVKEEKMNIVKISDWMPQDEPLPVSHQGLPASVSHLARSDSEHQSTVRTECHAVIELSELGLSIIDHTPEEMLYLSVQNLVLSHSSGLGSGTSRFKLKMRGIQVDNQLPLTPMPVLFRPQRLKEEIDYILKFSVTSQTNGSLDLCVYPYIGLHGPESSAFLINVHEPIIWRLHEMIQQVNLSRLRGSETTAVSIDPIIQIGVLDISEVRLKVSMVMSPTQRPKGVLGFWASLMTALGNMENMPVRVHQRFVENVCMRHSAIVSNATSNVQKDLLSQPLQLLSGVDILGNASSALGHMSKGVAALSMDKKFIQGRQRQEKVEDFGDVIRESGGALAKGFFRGVTGILTKPLEGAKSSGVEGFVQGVGKGIIGAAAQPVSGVLDLLSKTTEGANAMRMKIQAALTSEEQLLRRRLPRVISGDNLLRPYDEYKAQGQVILQLAESGSFLGQVDLFKVRGKFALTDAYEDHFMLPKGRFLVVTHRRAVLLQQPSNIISHQKKFSPAKDPCSILWDVLWDGLVTMELTTGKRDHPKAPPSRVILYLRTKSIEPKDQVRVVKCNRETNQALQIYTAIEQAMGTYGPNQSKGLFKSKVTRPYSPALADQSSVMPKEGVSAWSAAQVPGSLPTRSLFGTSPS